MRMKNLSGMRFGKLIAIEPIRKKYAKKLKWLCNCDCGSVGIKITSNYLIAGHTKSCGCIRQTNGGLTLKENKTYKVWQHMIDRCYNPKAASYVSHGGRGITVCKRWLDSFSNFFEDMGRSENKKQLDRIDNNGNYESSNCRWVTSKENCNNKRTNVMLTAFGKTQTAQQWAEEYGIDHKKFRQRLRRDGWTIERALLP